MNSTAYKSCAVPLCKNTTIKAPNKVFVPIPSDKTMQTQWLKLARLDPASISLESQIYFCEDHFDDQMQPEFIPTKFDCQPNKRKKSSNTERSHVPKKKRKTLIQDCEKGLEETSFIEIQIDPVDISSTSSDVPQTCKVVPALETSSRKPRKKKPAKRAKPCSITDEDVPQDDTVNATDTSEKAQSSDSSNNGIVLSSNHQPKNHKLKMDDGKDSTLFNAMDSGSEAGSETGSDSDDESDEDVRVDYKALREALSEREKATKEQEGENERQAVVEVNIVKMEEVKVEWPENDTEMTGEHEAQADVEVFCWSDDFSTFTGQEEDYVRSPGPLLDSQDPVDLFTAVWDENIIKQIVKETNRYARQVIAPFSDLGTEVPFFAQNWKDTNVQEMYTYFAILIFMSFCIRSSIKDYWTTGVMDMPKFRSVMPRLRFSVISRFLHFVNNESLDPNLSSIDKKVSKIKPILEHCNNKFVSQYVPRKHLTIKKPRADLKLLELSEAETGYKLRCLLPPEKNNEAPIYELLDGFLDVGHTVIIEQRYNTISLMRALKRRHTDVVGKIYQKTLQVPDEIKWTKMILRQNGEQVAQHCGDISLVAWKWSKIFTAASTYHKDNYVKGRWKRQTERPAAIATYFKYMNAVESNDRKTSVVGRGSVKKYMTVFRSLLSMSLTNAFIIYRENTQNKVLKLSEFRMKVAIGLLDRFSKASNESKIWSNETKNVSNKPCVYSKDIRRLSAGNHFLGVTPIRKGRIRMQRRCARCTAAGKRSLVTSMCSWCDVPLCGGQCWADYHTLKDLKSTEPGT